MRRSVPTRSTNRSGSRSAPRRKGESVKAAQLLDQVLAIEPLNREALSGRAILALEQANATTSLPERAAAAARSVELARTLRRVFDAPKKREVELYARALSAEAKVRVLEGKNDQALAILKEATSAGLEPYSWVERDESMASLRKTPEFQSSLKNYEATRLALARKRIATRLEKPLDLPFDFKLPDLENKPVSLKDFKGKVVLVDFWGDLVRSLSRVDPSADGAQPEI